jgi:uncharacterized protein
LNALAPQAKPFFLHEGNRSLFCVHYPPVADHVRGAVIFVPPFMEEMNKSRGMVSRLARALAGQGWHVLQLDLSGTGDSSGGYDEATWELWLDDIQVARQWLAAQTTGPVCYWGLRLGALLCCASLIRDPVEDARLLLWQPVVSGNQHVQQVLRLKVAAARLAAGSDAVSTQSCLAQLEGGEMLEVAGYMLAPQLLLPMAKASLDLPPCVTRVDWFELSPRAEGSLAPASKRVADAWSERAEVFVEALQGASFWQAQEIEWVPELLTASQEALSR